MKCCYTDFLPIFLYYSTTTLLVLWIVTQILLDTLASACIWTKSTDCDIFLASTMSVRLAIDQFTTPLEDTPSFKTTTESEILDILL